MIKSTKPDRSTKPSKPPAVAVKITTGMGHQAVRGGASRDEVTPVQVRRKKRVTTEYEALRLRTEWNDLEQKRRELERHHKELEAKRQDLENQWPEDLTRPHMVIPTIQAIDWEQQPAVPAEKIDWSKQGEPLRVRPTVGAMVTGIAMIVSILGAGAYFYWGIKLHVTNPQIHVPTDGVPWGVKSGYEMRRDAVDARSTLHKDIQKTIRAENDQLRSDLVKEFRAVRRRRRR